MHFAPVTRCATHSSLGCSPFDARPNSLTPSAHWTGSPTTFFFSRIAVRNPATASGRAAIPPAGPAPTTTASDISAWGEGGAIFGLRGGPRGGKEPPGPPPGPPAGERGEGGPPPPPGRPASWSTER